jgi:hypothetical protein
VYGDLVHLTRNVEEVFATGSVLGLDAEVVDDQYECDTTVAVFK